MTEREQLEQAIAQIEAQRSALGDAAADAAIAGLRQQLTVLEQAAASSPLIPSKGGEEGKRLAGERKLVTVMFADISGFTALSESMDPEAVRDLMNRCFERLVPIVERYGGVVDKFIGDEIMALFGAPVAHENDPERALRAALEMMDALAAFNLERETDLGIHFGINTGLVIAGGIGTGERQEYSVMGDAVNVASRLEDVSERGEILVGPDTHRLAAPLFAFETLEPVRVKGKAEPMQVYRLLGLKAEPGQVRGLEIRGISSPLVGRDAEFAAIKGCIERLLDGQGGIVSIIGEAGVGKSRLMAEILRSAQNDDCELLWLEGRTLSFSQTISYWPFQEIIRGYAGITEEDSEHAAWAKLEQRITALFPEQVAEVLPYLASLLALEVRGEYEERVKYLDGEAMGRQVFLASRRFFERLAQEQPLVLVFEDLHWMDESSVLLLEHLLPLVERVPLLIVGVSRPYRQTPAACLQEVAARDFSDCYTEIQLAPLSQADSAQLVRNLLAIEHLPLRVREMIVHKAEGNPFFLEEIIRTLIDAGAVVHEPTTGRWRATAQVETVTIPYTVQGVIMARVDRLDEDVKQALRTAAVIGRSFFYRVLRAVAEADRACPEPSRRELDQHLTELQEIQFIREKQRIPELEYIFKHALAQEATYESILLQKRRELHAQVGQAIETLFADRLDEFYGLLAYHYARAEVWEKAQDYLLKAGDQAGRVAADAEALAHYRRAMMAYARAFGDKWDPLQRAALERKMGEALFRRGEHQQALDYLQRALAYLGNPLPTSRWGVRLAILREIVRQIGHRLLSGLFLKPMGGPVSPAVEEEIRLLYSIGWIDVFSLPERYLLISLKALNTSEHSGFAYGVTGGFAGVGTISAYIPVFWLAKIYLRRAMALAEQIQDPDITATAHMCRAILSFYLAEWDTMIEISRRGAELFWETGNVNGWGFPVYQMAMKAAYQGDFSQALLHCRDLARIGQEGAVPQIRSRGLSTQGFVQQRLGQLDEAVATFQEALELAQAIPDQGLCISIRAGLGRCYLRQGRLRQALTALDASQESYVPFLGGDSYASLRNGQSEAYLLAAEQENNTERVNRRKKADWLKEANRACLEALKQGKAFRPGLPEAMRLQGTYEWLRGKPTAAQRRWQRSLALAEELGQPYDLGMTHLEMGQRLGERAHLERAEAILAEIGAEWDLARARELLGQGSER